MSERRTKRETILDDVFLRGPPAQLQQHVPVQAQEGRAAGERENISLLAHEQCTRLEEEEIDLETMMRFLKDTQEVSGDAELEFADVLPAMLSAGFSEKQCSAILKEILNGGEGVEEGGGEEEEQEEEEEEKEEEEKEVKGEVMVVAEKEVEVAEKEVEALSKKVTREASPAEKPAWLIALDELKQIVSKSHDLLSPTQAKNK